MDKLEDLLAKVPDEALRQRIEGEVAYLRRRKEYGLVFNRHIPENIAVPGFPIESGEQVALRDGSFSQTWRIVETDKKEGVALCNDNERRPLDDLVVVRRQDSPLFPFLEHEGSIGGGSGGRAPHALIEGENLQVLRLLAHTMPQSVDVIYIDPPYNTGARDWRYNNDYVDKTDPFRHSKWLAMMDRRLRIAKALLKPDGVIFVAIDEVENAALTLLMREVFSGLAVYNIAVECYAGAFSGEQSSGFVTTHENLVVGFPRIENILTVPNKHEGKKDIRNLYADGTAKARHKSPLKFYPIWVDKKTLRAVEVGEHLPLGESPSFDPRPSDNAVPVWPIGPAGDERHWRTNAKTMRERIASGQVRFEKNDRFPNGILGKTESKGGSRTKLTSLWKYKLHYNGVHGNSTLKTLTGTMGFNYPKSPYSVRKVIEAVCHDRPDAVILDFFAGSGSTLDAVCLLNAEDGGERRCILATNNEGGIFDEVLLPRVQASLTGKRVDGSEAEGDWLLHTDENEDQDPIKRKRSSGFPDERAEILRLRFMHEGRVVEGEGCESLIPALWLASGSASEIPDAKTACERGFFKEGDLAFLLDPSKMNSLLQSGAGGGTLHLLAEDSHGSLQEAASKHSDFRRVLASFESWRDRFSSLSEEAEG